MRRAPALTVLLGTVFLDMLGLGLIVPIVPALMTSVTEDAAAAVFWSGLLGSVYGLLQFVVSPLLGRLSDRHGRRPVLLASLTCLGVDWLAHAASPSPWTLLVFHAAAGACAATYTVVNAYIADVTEPGARAQAYGLVGAAFGLGFVAGPVLGGLLGTVDVRLPFVVAALLCFANAAYGWFVLPESRPGDPSTPLTLRLANPIGAIAAVLRRPVLGSLLGLASLCGTAFVSVPWLLYLLCAVGVLGSLAGAAAQSWIARAVRAEEQGTVQGALTGIGAVAETIVPITAGVAFGWSLTYASPGSVYLGAAVFAAGAALLLATTPDVSQGQ
ncbi:MFS transporter [Micromonospora sp. C95]|uniref:MFS transporter n=1 Tax=Micromonospora sp. C95 TaxID=2824882 RepID=UPI001B367E88|nr:MFS transporter [Micromonospora sp. C95]